MNKKKILIFGATGMAGHLAYIYLKNTGKYEVMNIVHRIKLTDDSIIIDVTNKKAVFDVINNIRPDFIINCIGVLIKGSWEHPENAIYINAYFPHLLKKISDEINAKLIHISTDCVFSGKKGHYTESDFRDADDIYGRSKALGEISNEKDLTIRTSIIGPELKTNGEGLFHWFMQQKGVINGFTTAIWGGVTTLELAKAIDYAIVQNQTGLVHLSNGEGINKYELLCLIKKIWNKKDIHILSYNTNYINKSIEKSHKFNYKVPTYEKMLIDQYIWMQEHPNLYLSYL